MNTGFDPNFRKMSLIEIEKNKLQKIKPHVVFWVVFVTYETAAAYFMSHKFSLFIDYFSYYSLNISLFYINAYLILHNAYNKKNFLLKAVLLGFAALIVYLGLRYLLHQLFTGSGIHTKAELGSLTHFFNAGIWRGLYFIGLSTAYVFSVSTIIHRKQISGLELQQLQNRLHQQKLEKNLLSSENAFLKAQVNPHFVFNSLNFIQNYVADYTEKGSELIIQLAEVMRYAFAEPAADGKVELSAEIEQLYNYQYLNQQRFNQPLYLDIQINGDTENIRIIPLVLISILENLFKYAELTDCNTPAKFCLNTSGEGISLYVHNQKAKRSHVSSSGIGMSNMQKRLNQFYPNQYTLTIEQNAHQYKLDLNIAVPAYDLLYN